MQMNNPMSLSSSSGYDHEPTNSDDFSDEPAANISFQFNQHVRINDSDSQQLFPDLKIHSDDENQQQFSDCDDDEEDDDDGDFTFMYVGDNDLSISEDENGQIRPVFPLFDQNLLLGGENDVERIDRLPIRPPVDKVFVESPRRPPSENDDKDRATVAPYCVWSKETASISPELRKKSNSTGFSKLWRLRDKVGRSNSDGRDAFVFLHSSHKTTTTSKSVATPATGDGFPVKVNAAGGMTRVGKNGTKAKKATASAHEVYLRNRVGQTEEDRRRSYLPYRPELMGISPMFTVA